MKSQNAPLCATASLSQKSAPAVFSYPAAAPGENPEAAAITRLAARDAARFGGRS
jgi:hypothetical protein